MRRSSSLLLALAALLVPLATPAVAAPAAPTANAWTEISHPRPGGADTYLNDVVTAGPGDVWAVGYTFDVVGGAFEFRTYGQHCVGGVCTRANLPSREGAPATNFLYGVDAASPTELWTVGYSRNPFQAGTSLAIRYTDGTWQIVGTPAPAGALSSSLAAVAAVSSTSAFAVGTYQESGTFLERPMAMVWNGGSWQIVTPPTVTGCNPGGRFTDVTDVAGTFYLVGVCRTPGGTEDGFVQTYRRGNWGSLLAPGSGLLSPGEGLAGVTVLTPASLWVVGSNLNAGTGVSAVYRNGAWTRLQVPQAGQYTQLNGVAGRTVSDVWTVGATSQGVGPQRLSLHRVGAGGSWTPVDAGTATSLAAVAYDPAGYYWAVGHNNSTSVVQRIDQ